MGKIVSLMFDNNVCLSCDTAIPEGVKGKKVLKGTSLLPNGGLLFYYEKESTPLFWNKDVPLDIAILYIDGSMTVQAINFLKKNSTEIAVCPLPIKYIVEVEAKTVFDLQLKVGSQVTDIQ